MATSYASLTTTFSAPTACWTVPWAVFGTPVWLKQGGDLNSTCFPPGFAFSPAETGTLIYSPGICPSGWSSACESEATTSDTTQTIAWCCPTNYGCVVRNPDHDWEASFGCVSPLSTVDRSAYNIPDSAVVVTSMYQMQVMIITATPTPTSTTSSQTSIASPASTSAPTSSPTSTSTSSSSPTSGGGSGGGLSSGAKAGISIGAIAGATMLALLGYIAWRLSPKKSKESGSAMEYAAPAYTDHPSATWYQPPAEMGATERAEMDAAERKPPEQLYEMRGS